MKEFEIDDIAGIINYVKSLDIYTQFDEIIITPIFTNDPMRHRFDSIEIGIKADNRLIFVHTERRLFTEPKINLDHYFEREIKYLSASVIFSRNLVHCIEDFDSYQIIDSDRTKLVIAKNETTKYALQVYLNDEEIAFAKVSVKFKFDHDAFESTHEFAAKKSIKIEELKETIDSFEKLKNSICLN